MRDCLDDIADQGTIDRTDPAQVRDAQYNVLLPSGVSSPREALFNYDWLALAVAVILGVIGFAYYLVARPDKAVREHMSAQAAAV